MTEIPNRPFKILEIRFLIIEICLEFRISCFGFTPFDYCTVNGEHTLVYN